MKVTIEQQRAEFSKKLAIVWTSIFVINLAYYLLSWFFFRETPPEFLFTAVTAIVGSIIAGYFAKAGVENYNKTKRGEFNYDPRSEATDYSELP